MTTDTAVELENLDVEFGDPKLMSGRRGAGLTPEQVQTIDPFIRGYPYTTLTCLCRKLGFTPAEAVTRIMAFEPSNAWWDEDEFAAALNEDAERLTAEGWEPGTPSPSPMTKGQAFQLFDQIVKIELGTAWRIGDMMHRMRLEQEVLGEYFVDYVVSELLSRMKYIDEQKWVFSPETITNAALNNSWIAGGSKRELTPYVHICPACGAEYTDTESKCVACGAPRCFQPERPIHVPSEPRHDDPSINELDELEDME
jgi:hypothetical protein